MKINISPKSATLHFHNNAEVLNLAHQLMKLIEDGVSYPGPSLNLFGTTAFVVAGTARGKQNENYTATRKA